MSELLDLTLLAELVRTPGLPGRETQVADCITAALPKTWGIHRDPLGNLLAHRPAAGPPWMLVAHMDEVGLIVRRITKEGFLLVERLGGMSLRALPGSRLTLWTKHGGLPAQAGSLPAHLDTNATQTWENVYVDIGAVSHKQAEIMGARVGDVLTWAAELNIQANNRLVGKALDDRLGCAGLISLARALEGIDILVDLTLAFVVQEETMLMGGLPAVNTTLPEVIVGVDGTLAFDTPDTYGQQSEIVLGAGPTLKWMDTIRGKMAAFVPDLALARHFREMAEKLNIPLQDEVVSGISTAVTPLPYTGRGARTAALSLPIRYHHTPVETADQRDVAALVQLLIGLVTKK